MFFFYFFAGHTMTRDAYLGLSNVLRYLGSSNNLFKPKLEEPLSSTKLDNETQVPYSSYIHPLLHVALVSCCCSSSIAPCCSCLFPLLHVGHVSLTRVLYLSVLLRVCLPFVLRCRAGCTRCWMTTLPHARLELPPLRARS